MDSDSWISDSTSSKGFQSCSGVGAEEYFGTLEDEPRTEYLCPFCAEKYDIVGLCCHIDEEHEIEAKNGVCPVCTKMVGFELIDHVIQKHGKILKCKKRTGKGGSNAFSKNSGSFFEKISVVSSSTIQPDPLLSLFNFSPAAVHEPDMPSKKRQTVNRMSDRGNKCLATSDKYEEEKKARKSEFVQGLLLSTFLNDAL